MAEEKKKSTYGEAQKRAIKKYMDNNREKINAQRREYYKTKRDTDPNYVKYKRDKAKEFYNRKKNKIVEDDKEIVKETPNEGINEFLSVISDSLKEMKF